MTGDMSMWMPMPGQTWLQAAASFVWMWNAMMAGMMLPSLIPMLRRYRHAVAKTTAARLGGLTAIASIGYFVVWAAIGVTVFPLGAALMAIEMRQPAMSRVVPLAVAIIMLIAGAVQFSRWKSHHLACCRRSPHRTLPADVVTAWRHGLRLGFHCTSSSAGLTAVLLTIGIMDMRVMAVVTAAITLERLAPAGERVAKAIGVATVGAGLVLVARVVGLG